MVFRVPYRDWNLGVAAGGGTWFLEYLTGIETDNLKIAFAVVVMFLEYLTGIETIILQV